MPHRIAVIGAGVIGLTSAIELLNEGHRVTIFTRERPEHTTSWIPAALWFPYHAKPEADVNRWALRTRERLRPLMENPKTGVRWVEFSRVWTDEEPPRGTWLQEGAATSLKPAELPRGSGFGYRIVVPLMENPTYMTYLRDLFEGSGGWEIGELHSIADIPAKYDVIVNCSGYGARKLTGDEQVRPGRGVAVLTEKIPSARCVVNDQRDESLMYVISRTDDCVFGGCNEDDETLATSLDEARKILARCAGVYASDVRIKSVEVGLRPMRHEVRLATEIIDGRNVVHNYGHGGSGFTLSWGCAEEVASRVAAM